MRNMVPIFILVCLAFCSSLTAQDLGPESTILGKGTFGINGTAILDVSSLAEYSYNPAVLPATLQFFGEDYYFETDYGVLNFNQGPRVTNDWQLAVAKLGNRGVVRVARYGINSSIREVRYLGPGPLVGFDGETYEVSYARSINPKLSLGVTLIPYENIKTTLWTPDSTLIAEGEASSSFHVRLAANWISSQNLSLGFVYTDDKIDSTLSSFGALQRADFTEQLLTLGATWQPRLGTVAHAAWQVGEIEGPSLSENIDLLAVGIQQFVNPNLYFSVASYDGVLGYGVGYLGDDWNAGASYSNNTYKRTRDYLGTTDTFYIWAGKSF